MPGTEATEIEIRLDALQPAEALHFDFRLIHEVLVCLLSNARRFTPNRGTVEVRGYPVLFREVGDTGLVRSGSSGPPSGWGSGDGYRIDVRDFGAPIPPGWLSSVFELSTDHGGGFHSSEGGLGLAMIHDSGCSQGRNACRVE